MQNALFYQIQTIKMQYFTNLKDSECSILLLFKTRAHRKKRKLPQKKCGSTGNPTIDACFDADRLDLGRVNTTPDPAKMATAKGKELASKLYKIRIKEFFCQAVGTDVLPSPLWRKPLIGVNLSVGQKLAVILHKGCEVAHQRI